METDRTNGGARRIRRDRVGRRLSDAALVSLVLSLSLPLAAGSAGSEEGLPPGAEETIALPDTTESVWCRPDKKRGIGGGSLEGDLIITERALEFNSRKARFVLPMDSIRGLSFGKMRGDVDTDWVLVELEDPEGSRVVGFRDGRKLGYGQRTGRIYDKLKRTMIRLAAAQYSVPEGFTAYDELDRQFTFAAPRGWFSYHETLVEVDPRIHYGRLVFSSEPFGDPSRSAQPAEAKEEARREALQRTRDGRVPAFFVDRREAAKGMRCEGFSEPAERELLRWASEEGLFGRVAASPIGWQRDPVSIAGCRGLRLRAPGRGPGGVRLTLELRAVSDGRTAVLLGMPGPADGPAGYFEPLDRAIETFRFSAAR